MFCILINNGVIKQQIQNLQPRCYVKIRTHLGKSTCEIHLDFVQVCSTKGVLSYAGVRRWAQRFRIGRDSVEDAPRPGAPITSVVIDSSDAIKKLIELDPHITIRELSTSVGISMGSVDEIPRT